MFVYVGKKTTFSKVNSAELNSISSKKWYRFLVSNQGPLVPRPTQSDCQ